MIIRFIAVARMSVYDRALQAKDIFTELPEQGGLKVCEK
jgi:hypothetical protein